MEEGGVRRIIKKSLLGRRPAGDIRREKSVEGEEEGEEEEYEEEDTVRCSCLRFLPASISDGAMLFVVILLRQL